MTYKCLKSSTYQSEDFRLEPIQSNNIESIRIWRNSQMDVLRQNKIITTNSQVDYFNHKVWPEMDRSNPDNILFSFFHQNTLVGYGGLVHISWQDLRSEISFLLNPIYLKEDIYKIYFSKYLTLIKMVAFEDLEFNRLFTETYNIRDLHISILESNGFVKEGVLREHLIINGMKIDSIFHGILNK
jgi:RimJ/RimL family protein N-acetyltransferase